MTKDQEWGNISLPGLSDDELFNKNWNKVAAGLENKNNAKLLELAKQKKNNRKFSSKMSKVASERNQNPEYLENLRHGVKHNRDNSYQAEVNRRPEKRALQSERQKGKVVSQETRDKLKSISTNKYGDANYEAAHKAGLAKRDTPFHAGEYGVFPSIAEAARQVEEKGLLTNAYKKFSKWKKEGKEGYYFIEDKNETI